jgi:DNA-binding NarL/FixJ family response regulator
MEKTRIIIVDDHLIIRDGLKTLLSAADDLEIVAEAGSAEEFLQKLRFHPAHVALVDINLPGISGIRLTEQLATTHPGLRVLILSMYLNEEYINSAMKAGALGYIAKNTTRDELISAVRAVAAGQRYLGREVSEVIATGYIRRIKDDEITDPGPLSRRETEILKLTAEGLGNKEISEKLFISIRTVESHKNHIMTKLDLKSSVEMVRYAIRTGLVRL